MAGRKSPLRVAEPGEKAAPAKPKSVTEAAKDGSHRELLVAMRNRIAEAVESQMTPARDLAALTKRLADVAREIEAIEAREAEEVGDSARTATDEAFDASAI